MPSLQDLKQLQYLIGKIGGEAEILEAEGIRRDAYELPANEPLPRPRPAEEVEGETPPPQPEAGESGAAELSAAPASSSAPPRPPVESAGDEADTGYDSIFDKLFADMDDLVSKVPTEDDLPPPPDIEDAPPGAAGIDDFSMDLGQPAEAEAGGAAGIDDFSLDLGQPAEAEAGETADIDDFSMDLGQPAEAGGTADIDDFSMDLGQPAEAEAGGAADIDDGFDLAGMLEDFDGDNVDTPNQAPDSDRIPSILEISDEEKASLFPDAPPAGTPAPDGGPSGDRLESLPDIEDFLPNVDALAKSREIAGPLPGAVQPTKPVEPINLTEKELEQLLGTIASYPLNLRVVCEKIIVEEIVEPSLMLQFIKLLIRGGNAREAAVLAGKILKRNVPLPKGYKTGEELEAEQSGFVYIFLHKFFPVIRVSMLIAALVASVAYLSHEFIYKPVRAYMIYKDGYERIREGEYALGNRHFEEAFAIHPEKKWFYRYAELFRDERQYLYAEEKYDKLLLNYPQDKKGTLDYASMEANYLRNYEKADRLIRTNILDYIRNDREGLLALGDVNLVWGEYDSSRYEEARLAYAKYMAAYGQTDPLLERMMLYFIRVDKLGEVIPLQNYFMSRPKARVAAPSLAELGGYLLDKRFEVAKGVPDEYVEEIQNVKDVLLRALGQDFSLPEAHYHLARYYNRYGDAQEERQTLETAAAAFDTARPESPKRTMYRVDTQGRLARLLISGHEFISAEEALVKGVNIMEDAVERRVLQRSAEFGKLYAYLGDLAYFTKSGDMREVEAFYLSAEETGWSPPEMQYRLGSAYYNMGEYASAMRRFFDVSMETRYNRRLLNTLGNVSYMRYDYDAAAGYFKRLIGMLESDYSRFPALQPREHPEHREIVERVMVARNNLGVTYNALAAVTGRPEYRAAALGEFAEAARAWDVLERNPQTLVRAGITDPAVPGTSLPYLNIQNTLYPTQGGNGLLFMRIDRDLNDNSWWEELMR
ncbi:MAG: tetratricopeptide repeat protein [Spirochaetaceae bacterium]|jgi:tetratricopeptide (TPR) repeat protein|nr:tetratricopeptide repeat protein [Spirochaetaceae bacterium]